MFFGVVAMAEIVAVVLSPQLLDVWCIAVVVVVVVVVVAVAVAVAVVVVVGVASGEGRMARSEQRAASSE